MVDKVLAFEVEGIGFRAFLKLQGVGFRVLGAS